MKMGEIDPDEQIDDQAGKVIIIAGVKASDKHVYPCRLSDAGELIVDAEFTGDVQVDAQMQDILNDIVKFVKWRSGAFPEIPQPINSPNTPYLESIPFTMMGAFKGFIDENYALVIADTAKYWMLVPSWYVKRITGFISHSNTAAGLTFAVREASYPIDPTTPLPGYFTDPTYQTTLGASNQMLPIDIEPKSEYVLLIIENQTGGPVTLAYNWEFGVV